MQPAVFPTVSPLQEGSPQDLPRPRVPPRDPNQVICAKTLQHRVPPKFEVGKASHFAMLDPASG